MTPLFWIAKTSATWRLKIASKSFDAFFPRKRRKVPRFQLKKTSDRKISWYLYCKVRSYLLHCTDLLPKFYANWVKIIIYLSLSLVLPFMSHRLHLARKYVHQRKVWKPGISLKWMKFLLYIAQLFDSYKIIHSYFKR